MRKAANFTSWTVPFLKVACKITSVKLKSCPISMVCWYLNISSRITPATWKWLQFLAMRFWNPFWRYVDGFWSLLVNFKRRRRKFLPVSRIQTFCSEMAGVFGVRRWTLCVYNGFWEPFWHLFSDVFGNRFCIDFSLTFYRFSVPLNLAKSDFYVGRVANFMVLQASIFVRF